MVYSPLFRLLVSFEQLKASMTDALQEVFFPDAVDEWIVTNMEEKLERLAKVVEDVEGQLKVGARVKDSADMEVNGS